MNSLHTKIAYYKDRILHDFSEDIMPDLELFITQDILPKLKKVPEDTQSAFTVFNELADLKAERVYQLLESCLFINLWNEHDYSKELFWGYLNERARKLYDEAVWLYTNGATPEEQVYYRKKHDL